MYASHTVRHGHRAPREPATHQTTTPSGRSFSRSLRPLGHVAWWGLALALLTLLFPMLSLVRSAPVRAAPASARANISPHIIEKVILADTSVAGPAIAGLSGAYEPAAGNVGPNMAMAWAGTNPMHNLTVELSHNGIKFYSEYYLPVTSQYRPAILLVRENTLDVVILAWTNTSSYQQLHIMYDVYNVTGHREQIVLPEQSNAGPALTKANGQIWIAWAGTDKNHSLNIQALGASGIVPGQKDILHQFSAHGGPSLITGAQDHYLQMTWADTGTNHTTHIAVSQDGVRWVPLSPAPEPETSIAAPALLSLVPMAVPSGTPYYYWAWTGTDPHRTLNVTYSLAQEHFAAPAETFDETSIGSPGLAYVGTGGQFILAWTGTDPRHHLNVAIVKATN